MPITFDCPCGKTLRVPDTSAGKRAKCPVCSAVFAVPDPDPVLEVVEVAPPPLPPEPVEAPKPYRKPSYEDEEEDKTPYGLIEPEKASTALDRDGNPRKKDGLPNFNKGRKNYG